MCDTLHNALNQHMRLKKQYENIFEAPQTSIRQLETLESINESIASTKLKNSKDSNNTSLPEAC